MKPNYIQASRVYPSPRNSQYNNLAAARNSVNSHTGSYSTLKVSIHTNGTFYKDSANSSVSSQLTKTAANFYPEQLMSLRTPSATVCCSRDTSMIKRPLTPYTPPCEEKVVTVKTHYSHRNIARSQSQTKEECLPATEAVYRCKQQVLSSIQKYKFGVLMHGVH